MCDPCGRPIPIDEKWHAPSGETSTIDRLLQRRLHVNETNHICSVLFSCYGYLLFNSFTVTYLCVYNIELTLSVFVMIGA